jgi:uncharacterized damage-inducible protein DinB
MIRMLKREVDQRLDEGAGRIETCLKLVSQEELWQKPGPELVSIGNLVCHLRGNISQWILKELGDVDFVRQRSEEFTATTDETPAQLADKIRTTIAEARVVVGELSVEDLQRSYTVQGFAETGVGILVHVVEHLSYHVGQITFYVKLLKGVDVGYYRGKELDIP